MITLTFTADNFWSLREQMLAFISIGSVPGLPPQSGADVQSEPLKRPRGRPRKETEAEQIDRIEDAAVQAIKASLEKEMVETSPIEAVGDEEADEVEKTEAPAFDAIANEKVKQEVIAQLSDLFTAGKVKTLRHILDTYGHGAKSFPEIDASQFPAIREALSRGEAA